MSKKGLGIGKIFSIIFSFVFISLVNIKSVFAYGTGDLFGDMSRGVSDVFTSFLTPLFAGLLDTNSYDQYFFARVLLLFLVFVIVYVVLKSIDIFKDHLAIVKIVSGIIAILGIRYLTPDNITAILLPYSTLAVSLSILLPGMVYFFFIHKAFKDPAGRRVALGLYLAVTFSLYLNRRSELGGISNIYPMALLIILLLIIFDPMVHHYFFDMVAIRRFNTQRIDARIAYLQSEIARNTAFGPPSPEQQRVIRECELEIARLRTKRGGFWAGGS